MSQKLQIIRRANTTHLLENPWRTDKLDRTYNALWKLTQQNLTKAISKDRELQKSYYDERIDLVKKLRNVYVQYLCLSHSLDTCYNNMIQPQKRRLIRKILDLVLCRVVEIKHELVAIDLLDIQHCDEAMEDLQLCPKVLSVTIPKYVRRERLQSLKERSTLMEESLRKAGLHEPVGEEQVIMSFLDAIKMIQRHERAKQGRAKALLRKQLIARQELEKARGRSLLSRDEAVVRIQSYTRGMIARRRVLTMRKEEEIFLGLRPDFSVPKVDPEGRLTIVQEEHYAMQICRRKEEQEVKERLQAKIIYEEGPALMADMEQSIREWIFQEKNETGKFPDIPEEEDGGSAAILGRSGHFVYSSTSQDTKGGDKNARDDSKQKKKEPEESRISSKPTTLLSDIKKGCEEYKEVWSWRTVDEDCEEKTVESLLEGEIRATVEEEVRKKVDSLMRHELQKLKEEVEGEKKGAKKKKKMKKGRGRKRKDKDLTPDRTTESLFEELVLNGIIKKVPEISLDDIAGDINIAGSAAVETTKYALPSLADMKNILAEYIGLPLGVDLIRNTTPLVKSVLLTGPRASGKTTLVHALCHDLGATLFDLTSSNIVGRYPGRAGLNMLTHLILKVGRLLQPSVILIDEADKMFMKKIPKTDKSDPKRLKKELPKIVKNIGIEDRIVVLGVTNSPWNCDAKALSSVYQKILLLHRPTFGARCDLWRLKITDAGGKITSSFDLAILARISDGYCIGHITVAVSKVLTEQRLSEQEENPLKVGEFIQPLAKMEPIYKEEEEAFKTFFHKTPLMKKRARLLEEELEAALAKAKAESKGTEQQTKTKPKKKKKKKKGKKKT